MNFISHILIILILFASTTWSTQTCSTCPACSSKTVENKSSCCQVKKRCCSSNEMNEKDKQKIVLCQCIQSFDVSKTEDKDIETLKTFSLDLYINIKHFIQKQSYYVNNSVSLFKQLKLNFINYFFPLRP